MAPPETIAGNNGEAKRHFNFNTVFGVVFVVLSAVLFFIIPDQIEKPLFVLDENENALKPSLFPQLVAVGFGGLGLWLVFKSRTLHELNEIKSLELKAIINVAVTLVIMLAYVPMLTLLGFVVSSAIVVAALSTFFGNRNYVLTAVVSVVVPISIFFVFTKLLATFLPPFPIDTPLTRLYIL